jgi:uncharacterized protein VirK/YbjX
MSLSPTRWLVLDAFKAVTEPFVSGEDGSGATLSDLPSFRALVEDLAQSFKVRDYLARSLSRDDRYACCRHHYLFLGAVMPLDGFRALISSEITLLESHPDATHYSVHVGASREYDHEGEIAVDLRANGRSIFVFHFTFIPGYIVGSTDWTVALLSRMQGRRNVLTEIRLATKEMADCSPQAVLFACLRGVAKIFGVRRIAGPSGTNQYCSTVSDAERLARMYDEFFRSVEASEPRNGFYLVETTPSDGSQRAKSAHPARAQKKRQIKSAWTETAAHAWLRAWTSPRAPGEEPLSIETAESENLRKRFQLVCDELNATRTKLIAAEGELDSARRDFNVAQSELEAVRQELIETGFELSATRQRLTSALSDYDDLREDVNRTLAHFVAEYVKKKPLWIGSKSFAHWVLKSGIFDQEWYLSQNPDVAAAGVDPVAHYLKSGAREKRSPSRFFSTEDYLALNPDVAQSGVNPLFHYYLYGAKEGRKTHQRRNKDRA